jgi:hypothetical protein
MDARVNLKVKMPSRRGTESPVRSGRTLAEMASHIFSRNEEDIVRLDVACGSVEATSSHLEPAERARSWRSRKTGYRSGAAGKHAHVLDAVLHDNAGGRSGAKETQCYANI